MSADVPFFKGTEEALAYGRSIDDAQFRTLVRTYFATNKALATVVSLNIEDLQMRANLACRLQLLRESIEEFLHIAPRSDAAAEPGAQLTPATTDVGTDSHEPVHVSPAADPFVAQRVSPVRPPGVSPGDPFLEWHGVYANESEIGHS